MSVEMEGPYRLMAVRNGEDGGPFGVEGFVHLGMAKEPIVRVKVPHTFKTTTEATAAGLEAARQAAKRLIERDSAAD
jgi:hypothetical protein